MKKFFTLLALTVMAMTAQAAITIYVKCATAPYIWSWSASDGVDYNVGDWPGTNQLTATYTHPDTQETFWTYTFPESVTKISFLFNDGASTGTKQTSDIKEVTTERWFILSWDDGEGNIVCTDVTADYSDVEIPDATVSEMDLRGNHNNWGNAYDDGTEATKYPFDVIEAGKTFRLTMDMTELVNSVEEGIWKFKPVVDNSSWIGYYGIFGENGTTPGAAPEWLKEASSDSNFEIDLEEGTTERIFTFTMTWNGGKAADENWTMTAQAGTEGIDNVLNINTNANAPRYNLQGQRVTVGFKGIGIQNGRKVIVK
ncbi:MAG: hypothetical protein IJ551_10825 [Prevotella sp.]|nr:hypothetical protein [Prevotella sp.]